MCLFSEWRTPVPTPQTTLPQPLGAPLLCAPRPGLPWSSLGSRTRPWWQSEPLVPVLPVFCGVGGDSYWFALKTLSSSPEKREVSSAYPHPCPQSFRVSGSQDPPCRGACALGLRGIGLWSVSGRLSSAASSPAPRAAERQQWAGDLPWGRGPGLSLPCAAHRPLPSPRLL